MDIAGVAISGLSGAGLTASAFYALTNWRLKKLEDRDTTNQDTRERLIRIEAMVKDLYYQGKRKRGDDDNDTGRNISQTK